MCAVLSSTGSEFHSVGPETAKLRGPMRIVRVRTSRNSKVSMRSRSQTLGSITNWWNQVRKVWMSIPTQALVDKNSKFVLNSLADWKPVQLIAQIVRDGIELPLSQDQAGRRAEYLLIDRPSFLFITVS